MPTIQVEVGHTATLEARFYADGVLTDDGTPTIGITKADGTVLVAAGTATTSGGVGIRQRALPAQTELNMLRATWTGTTQTVVTEVEIVGGVLFTLAQLRALRVAGGTPFSSTATPLVTDQQIMDARAATLDEFTRILDWSPVPRFAREVHDGGRSWLRLRHTKAGPLVSVAVDGAAQTVADYTLRPSGLLEGSFASGSQNVAVEYVHGTAQIPGDGARQAMLYAAAELNPSVFTSGTTVTTPDGVSVTYEPSEMGRQGYVRHTGIRSVDRYLNRWSDVGLVVA